MATINSPAQKKWHPKERPPVKARGANTIRTIRSVEQIQGRRDRLWRRIEELAERRPRPSLAYDRAMARYLELSWIMHSQPTADAMRAFMSDLRAEYQALIYFRPRPVAEIDRNVHRWHELNWALGNRGRPIEE